MTDTFEEFFWRSADGLRLHARAYDGAAPGAPTALCLHGLTRTCRDFEDLAPYLQNRFQVLAPDFRGRGQSDRDPDASHYQPAVYLKDVMALLDERGLDSVLVIGTSLGGLVGMLLAATAPARITALVLNDVGPEIDPAGAERIRGYAGRLPAVATWSEAVGQARAVYEQAWPGLEQSMWRRLARRAYRQNSDGQIEADADPAIGQAFRGAPAAVPTLWPVWQALRAPTLVLRGAHSDILSRATVARMLLERPDTISVEVPERGHVPLLDEPAALAAIDRFLTRHAAPTEPAA